MKKHFVWILVAAFLAGGIIAQSVSSLDRAIKDVEGNVQSVNPPLAVLAKGLVDNNGVLALKTSGDDLILEGATADAFETTIAPTDPTADRTITLPNGSGTPTLNSVSAYAATATAPVGDLYGATLTNTGAAGAVVITLPAPVVGMEFTVFLSVAQDVDINPANGTQILVLTNATGDAISSAATIGNRITLRAISTTEWIPLETSGTWSDAN